MVIPCQIILQGVESMFSQDIREIAGFEGYYVSYYGEIFSTRKNGGYYREMTPMILKEFIDLLQRHLFQTLTIFPR